jgi:hypothetical protein
MQNNRAESPEVRFGNENECNEAYGFKVELQSDNGNVHRAAAKIMQAEKAARPAAPCATYCYRAVTSER